MCNCEGEEAELRLCGIASLVCTARLRGHIFTAVDLVQGFKSRSVR